MVEVVELGTGRTGGREATTGVIPGRYALSVGMPSTKAPPGWAWTPLSSVAQLESGHTPSRKHPEYWNGNIPWIGIKDASENHGRTIQDTYQHVTQLGLDNSSARLLPANTICLSRTASVGFVVVMGCPMATSQDFVNWVCGPLLDPLFLKYILVAETEALWRFASGTTHQTIYFPEAKAFHICMPPIAAQREIVSILNSLDAKIEINRRMNATLEAVARALFQSWFVDFDPVRAKQNGRQHSDLDPDIAALFPSALDNTGLGLVPAGWEITTIGDLVPCVGGSTPSTSDPSFWEPGVHRWTTPKDFSALQAPVLIETERRISDAGLERISSGLLPTGTVLLSSRAPVGYLAISAIPVAINQGFIAMRCHERASSAFTLNWCQTHMAEIEGRASGTTFPEISKSNFRPIKMVLPPAEIMAAFTTIVTPLYDRITKNLKQSNELAQVRDTILPRLLNGEIQVAG